MKLYFIRHGENQANIDRIFSYRIVDYPLTPKGIEQARYLATWLADRHIVRVYSSPLKRAFETAEIVAKNLELPQVTLIEGLRELNVGILDGKSDPESWVLHDDIVRRWFEGEAELTFEGGENRLELEARFKASLDRILAENSGLNDEAGIAIVAHGGVLVFGLPVLCNNLTQAQYRRPMPNTAVAIVEVKDGQLSCSRWNSIEHLPLL